ncbi:hypothetical protein DFR29_12030 [Tahibacter aquaticus]|uniref:Uncharacterized protein n=1 Tax=Tahibacter aquaticus TaxID=520092 RepID=A0A4R6YM88_9GAMM|nr:hypothetical protein DFR29_12030 [Tahibacter aquaticus]
MAKGLDQVQAPDLHVVVKHVGSFAPGAQLFREVGRGSRERLDQPAISLLAVCRAARVGPPQCHNAASFPSLLLRVLVPLT